MTTPSVPGGLPVRPDYLQLHLQVELGSRVRTQNDDFGWDTWHGTLVAGWNTTDNEALASQLANVLPEFEEALGDGEDGLQVAIGGCELMVLRLGRPHPVFGERVFVELDPLSIYDAADALSQDLADVVGALSGNAGGEPFVDQIIDANENAWYEQLVILRSIGIHEKFRGMGIGGWFGARALAQLAPDAGSLIALKAAPLSRTDFLTGLGVEDPKGHKDFTEAQSKAWAEASARIAANWCRHLGVQPLADDPTVLFGLGGENEQRAQTFASWFISQ